MACGPAMAERWGVDPSEAGGRDDIWRLEAAYLAQFVRVLVYSFAPDRIVFGGGVGSRPGLAGMIRAESRADLGGYADYAAGRRHVRVRSRLGRTTPACWARPSSPAPCSAADRGRDEDYCLESGTRPASGESSK